MCVQAWAFATAARKMLGKSPPMSISNFDREVWVLHRKLHHRYIKYVKSFERATQILPGFGDDPRTPVKKGASASAVAQKITPTVICLLSDSDKSADSDDDDAVQDDAVQDDAVQDDAVQDDDVQDGDDWVEDA
jgi:hypothetical protein